MNRWLVKSQFLQFVKNDNHVVAYHSLFGYPQILNADAVELLNCFSCKQDEKQFFRLNAFENAGELVELFKKIYFLVTPNFDERQLLREIVFNKHAARLSGGNGIEYLSLITSEKCNFACKYCISNSMISETHRKQSTKRIMSFLTAKKAVDIFLSILESNGNNKAYINFGGGEPLINWEVVEKTLVYCVEKYGDIFQFSYTINTNGSLISEEVANKLKKYHVEIALSLDGLQAANDKVRIMKSGKSTFPLIMRAMKMLEDSGHKLGGFSTTMNEDNFEEINEELVFFAVEKGFKDFRLDLDVIHMLGIPIESVIAKLLKIKRLAAQNNIAVTGFWERPVESFNSSILEKHIAFCGGVTGRSLCISPSGEIFICGYSATKISNLTKKEDIIESKVYCDIVTSRLAGQIQRCIGCPIEGQCMGGCFITEEFSALSNRTALEYNCHLYKRMTVELLKDALREATAS